MMVLSLILFLLFESSALSRPITDEAIFGWVDPITGVPYPPGVKVHPMQLYELIPSLIGFSILGPLRNQGYQAGTIFWLY